MLIEYLKNVIKRRKIVLVALSLFVTSVVLFFNSDMSPDVYFLNFNEVDNISCHYSFAGDALPQIDDTLEFPVKSIFFHETSCRGLLNSRQACAVESAARLHPNWQVNVLFAGPVSKENLNKGSLKTLQELKNAKLFRLHIVDYAKGTPLEEMVRGGALNRTRWRISHASDALRYLSLYKWGGVYLDLDLVVVKSFEKLVNNWAARESDTVVAAGALAFSRDRLGRIVADTAIRDLRAKYRGDDWGYNGPGVITRTLRELCDTHDIAKMSEYTCSGIAVYGPELFYPVSWTDAKRYFTTGELDEKVPYAFHVWNKITQHFKVEKDSAYAILAKKYCPSIYNLYGDEFGS